MRRWWFAPALACASALAAQTVELQTEFLRTGPYGRTAAADATPAPREILSPAVVRNAFASFHVTARAERLNYFLFAASNPANVFRIAIYREEYVQRGQEWIPDTLKPLPAVGFSVIPDPESAIAGQNTRSYLLDVWVPRNAPVGRTRLEVQAKAGGWTICPMEVRILPVTVPDALPECKAPLPDPGRGAAESVAAPLADYLAGRRAAGASRPPGPLTLRDVIRRNALQDMALAATLDTKQVVPVLQQLKDRRQAGGEWYLGVRDWIYRKCGQTGR